MHAEWQEQLKREVIVFAKAGLRQDLGLTLEAHTPFRLVGPPAALTRPFSLSFLGNQRLRPRSQGILNVLLMKPSVQFGEGRRLAYKVKNYEREWDQSSLMSVFTLSQRTKEMINNVMPFVLLLLLLLRLRLLLL